MQYPLIGLGGLLRSGKDTVADYLVEHYGYQKMGMSDPLLEMALVLDPIIPTPSGTLRLSELVELAGYVTAKQYPEVRRFLQQLGTDVGRNMIDQDLWVNIAQKKIQKLYSENVPVVLTGVRFGNELEMVHRLDRTYLHAASVWVDRDLPQDPNHSTHASEATLSAADFQVRLDNNGTLEDLYRTTDAVLKELS